MAFLALAAIVLPMVPLSRAGQLTLAFVFVATLILGAFAAIQHRALIYFVTVLALSTFAVTLIAGDRPSHRLAMLDTTLRVACLSILVLMTLKRTLRPGRVTVYRVFGGIAGYLLIGYTWTFAYQLLLLQAPGAIHFEPAIPDAFSQQPSLLMYFSFVTLTTVGYGDVRPVHPAARSLAVAEALVGQLYVAVLIGSLVGMALQAKSTEQDPQNEKSAGPPLWSVPLPRVQSRRKAGCRQDCPPHKPAFASAQKGRRGVGRGPWGPPYKNRRGLHRTGRQHRWRNVCSHVESFRRVDRVHREGLPSRE